MNHTDVDKNLVLLKKYIMNGFPDKLDSNLNQFKPVIDELSITKGCIMYRDRVFIPETIRERVLNIIHENHPGISGMKQSARSLIWFSGMDKAIVNIVKSC